MRRRLGPLIRWVHHSIPPHLAPQELSTAYRHFRPNQRLRNWLNMSAGQALSANIRKPSSLGATEVPRWRCNESAFLLNFLNLHDHSCLATVVNQPSSEQTARTKFCRLKLAFTLRAVACQRS